MRVLTLALLAATLSGCMGGDNSRLSEREFVERTSALCRARTAENDWPATFSPFDFSPKEWRVFLDRERAWLNELRALEPPAELDRKWDTVMSAAERLNRANGDLYAVSPRPKRDSAEWQRAEREANRAERQLERLAPTLPVGSACRTG